MKQKPFVIRTGIPVGGFLLAVGLATFIIEQGWRFGWAEAWDHLYTTAVFARILLMLFAIYVIYPLSYLGGAPRTERIVAAFTPNLVWLGNEFAEMITVYSPGETLYAIFNPGFLFFMICTLFQIGLCDLICRFMTRKRFPDGHALPLMQAGLLVTVSPLLQGVIILFFVPLIDLYWIIHRGVIL